MYVNSKMRFHYIYKHFSFCVLSVEVKFSSSDLAKLMCSMHTTVEMNGRVHFQLILLQRFVQGSYSWVNLEGKAFKKKVIFLT